MSLVETVRGCRGLKPLEEHLLDLLPRPRTAELGNGRCWDLSWIARLARPASKGQDSILEETVRNRLMECVQAGLLVSDTDLSAAFARGSNVSATDRAIRHIAILTRDRPGPLRRALDSYLRNASRFGRKVSLIVLDDSRTPEHSDQNRAAATELEQRHGVPAVYIGAVETDEYVQRLLSAGTVSPKVLRFALYGEMDHVRTLGANRNRLLLRTLGRALVSVDDDTVCELRSQGSDPGIALEGDSTVSFWYFANRASAVSHLPLAAVDFLGPYEEMLGKTPGDFFGTGCRGGGVHSRTLDPALLSHLLASTASILYCMPGLAGDCATWAPRNLTLGGPSRARMVETESSYRTAANGRNIVRCAERATITAGSFCMGYALGLDNRASLPPFFPLLRNTDGVFGETLQFTHPGALRADLPYAIVHDPDEERSFGPVDGASALCAIRISEVLIAAIRVADAGGAESPIQRTELLGRQLRELAKQPLDGFEEAVWDGLSWAWAQRGPRLESMLQHSGERPGYWARDARRALLGIRAGLRTRGPIVPLDLRPGNSHLETRTLTQRLVGQFGEVLTEWEAIRHAAHAVNGDMPLR